MAIATWQARKRQLERQIMQGANRGQWGKPEKGEEKGTMQGANRGQAKAEGARRRGGVKGTCESCRARLMRWRSLSSCPILGKKMRRSAMSS